MLVMYFKTDFNIKAKFFSTNVIFQSMFIVLTKNKHGPHPITGLFICLN